MADDLLVYVHLVVDDFFLADINLVDLFFFFRTVIIWPKPISPNFQLVEIHSTDDLWANVHLVDIHLAEYSFFDYLIAVAKIMWPYFAFFADDFSVDVHLVKTYFVERSINR